METKRKGGWLRDKTKFRCRDCGEIFDRKAHPNDCTFQFVPVATHGNSSKVCFACAANLDRKALLRTPVNMLVAKPVLYLKRTADGYITINNRLGTLKFRLLRYDGYLNLGYGRHHFDVALLSRNGESLATFTGQCSPNSSRILQFRRTS